MKRIFLKSIFFAALLIFGVANACYNTMLFDFSTGNIFEFFGEVIEFGESEVVTAPGVEKVALFKDGNGFHVIEGNFVYHVDSWRCGQMLPALSDEQLKRLFGKDEPKVFILTPEEFDKFRNGENIKFDYSRAFVINEKECNQIMHGGQIKIDNIEERRLGKAYISICRWSDREYQLELRGRVLGGGWVNVLKGIGLVAGGMSLGFVGVGIVTAPVAFPMVKVGVAYIILGGVHCVYGATVLTRNETQPATPPVQPSAPVTQPTQATAPVPEPEAAPAQQQEEVQQDGATREGGGMRGHRVKEYEIGTVNW